MCIPAVFRADSGILLRERIYHKCLSVCFPDQFIEHGTPEELYEKYGLDAVSVSNRIVRKINGE